MALGGAAAFDGFEALVAELLRHLLEPLGQRRQRSDVGEVSFGERVAAHAEQKSGGATCDSPTTPAKYSEKRVVWTVADISTRRRWRCCESSRPARRQSTSASIDRSWHSSMTRWVTREKWSGQCDARRTRYPVVQYHSRVRLPSSRVPWPIRSPTRWPYPVSTARLCSACAALGVAARHHQTRRPPAAGAIFPASSSIIGTRDTLAAARLAQR